MNEISLDYSFLTKDAFDFIESQVKLKNQNVTKPEIMKAVHLMHRKHYMVPRYDRTSLRQSAMIHQNVDLQLMISETIKHLTPPEAHSSASSKQIVNHSHRPKYQDHKNINSANREVSMLGRMQLHMHPY